MWSHLTACQACASSTSLMRVRFGLRRAGVPTTITIYRMFCSYTYLCRRVSTCPLASMAKTYGNVDVWCRGAIYGMVSLGANAKLIQQVVRKGKGVRLGVRTVERHMAQCKTKGGALRVQRYVPKKCRASCKSSVSSVVRGRPRCASASTRSRIVQYVLRHRGHLRTTAPRIRKEVMGCDNMSLSSIRTVLRDSGLQYLPRRRKTYIGPDLCRKRMTFARRVLRWKASYVRNLISVDGATFTPPISRHQKMQKARRNLGGKVWRLRTGVDALHPDCVGASKYTQGGSIKMWGFLSNGALRVHILPEGENMTGKRYAGVIRKKYPKWWRSVWARKGMRQGRMLQDNEKCLWSVASRAAMRSVGVTVVEKFPPHSPDLNPIENAWRLLKGILDENVPPEKSSRRDHVLAVHTAVRQVNNMYGMLLRHLTECMKDRAKANVALSGARTKY